MQRPRIPFKSGQRLLHAVLAVAALMKAGANARGDLAGFGGFSPVNTGPTAAGDSNIGYQAVGTALELTDGINNQNVSGWNPTPQNISSFSVSFNYQTLPQYGYGTYGQSLQANGAALVLQNPTTGSTTALGAAGNGLGYTGIGSKTAGIGFSLFNNTVNYGGGSLLLSAGGLGGVTNLSNVDLSKGDVVNVHLNYFGTTITGTVFDPVTQGLSTFTYSGVNLASTLGSPTAIVGFSGSTGGYNSTQKISNFTFVSNPTYAPIAVSGFTQRMILPATAPQSGATASITASMDSGTANLAGNVFYEKGYNTAAPTTGLPASGSTFTSADDSQHAFTMQNYSNNDAILLSNSANNVHTTATLALATPAAYRSLSILDSSGYGPNYFNIIINYADGAAASTISNIISPNWFNQTANVAYVASGRAFPSATGSTTFNTVNTSNPVLSQQDINLPDTADAISSITFNYFSGSGNTAIFAVSGVASPSVTLKYGGSDPTTPGQFDNGVTYNFNSGTGNAIFLNGDVAIFDDSAIGPHTVSIAAAGVMPASLIFNNNTSTYTINGPGGISGTGGLTVSGTNLVTINSSNSYSGNTTVNSGTLTLGSSSTIASSVLNVSSGGTLNVLAGAQMSASGLVLTDNGTVNLYQSLTLPALNGSGAVTLITPNTTLTLLSAGSYTGSLNGNGIALLLGGNGGTFSGHFYSSTGTYPNSVTVTTTGTWLLNGSSTYAGGTTLSAGITEAGTNAAFGVGPINLSGGSLSSSTPVVLSNLIIGGALKIAGGSNVVELNNSANSFSGPVSVLGGTLQIDNQGALGLATAVAVSKGASFEITDNTGLAGAGATVTITGPGMTSTYSSPIVNGPTGALRGVSGASSTWAGGVNVSGGAYVEPGADGTLTLTGSIAGTGGITYAFNTFDQNGATIVLAPAPGKSNSYTGETKLIPDGNINTTNPSQIELGANNGISPNSGLNVAAGSSPEFVNVDLQGYNQSLQYLEGGGQLGYQIKNSGTTASTLTITSGLRTGGPATAGLAIAGNVAVVMNDPTGLGNQILAGSSTYTGGTTITKGKLSTASNSALGTSTVTLNGGTLGLAASNITPGTAIVSSSNLSSFTLNTAAGTSPTLNGSGSMTALTLTAGTSNTAVSAFYPVRIPVSDSLGFTASFNYNNSAGYADGMAFVLQNDSRMDKAVGGSGSELGYGGTNKITNSAAIEIDLYPFSNGPGTAFDSSGLVPGDAGDPQTQFVPTQPVDIASKPVAGVGYIAYNQPVDVTLVYNGPAQTLTETLHGDTEGTTFITTYTGVDYASLLGGTAGGSVAGYLGFTASTGQITSTQIISNLSYSTNASTPQSISNSIMAAAGTVSTIQIGVNSGSVTTGASIGSITISDGAVVALTVPANAGSAGVLFTPSLAIAANATSFSGRLDLGSNDLVVNGGTMTLTQITAMISGGYNNGGWNGYGIASSAAANDSTHLTALGVIVNDNGSGTPLYGLGGAISLIFDGSIPADGDILVKYTYYGDANLDGKVDGSDYSRIDNGYLGQMTGWANGDFNYDGVIDGSDYTLIDNAFNTQGSQINGNSASLVAKTTEQIAVTASVPEPTISGLLTLTLIGTLRRRVARRDQ